MNVVKNIILSDIFLYVILSKKKAYFNNASVQCKLDGSFTC